MSKPLTTLVLCMSMGGLMSCSDDDGSDVPRNNMTAGTGGNGEGGSSMDAGRGGTSGSSGGGSGGASGASGASNCPDVILDGGFPERPTLDAGLTDAGTSDAGDLDASTSGGTPGVVSFALDVHPILVASCGPCHVDEGGGGHNVASDDLVEAYGDAVALGETLVARVNGGGMPPSYAEPPNDCDGNPGDPGCLTVAEVELIQTWLGQCTPR